jgi:hypothetical protein
LEGISHGDALQRKGHTKPSALATAAFSGGLGAPMDIS